MGLAVNNIVQVTHRGHCLSQKILLVTHWRVVGTNSAANIQTELAAIVTKFGLTGGVNLADSYLAMLPQNYTMVEVRAQKISPTREAYVSGAYSAPGTVAVDATAPQTSCAVEFFGALAERYDVATHKIGPLAPTRYSGGFVTAAQITAMAAFGAQWIQDVTVSVGGGDIGLRPVIYHTTGTVPVTSSDIIGHREKDTLRVARRRTVGLGE